MRSFRGLPAAAILMLAVTASPALAAPAPVSASFTATGQTAAFTPSGAAQSVGGGAPFNISIWGTFVGTVRLERSFDQGVTWLPITAGGYPFLTFTTPVSEQAEETEAGVQWRADVTNYVSGTVNVRISQ